ncbi:HAD family hydrolase [Glycomyces paridis]|uniref:HAD family hydrolase n=1 Tax=Glycomyces paridis TaxID=2126555 RepID=A0A4V4HNM0_9ACTN|nr:HAD-IA family hydrolase [Glycomyces paridis]THV26696.1 HAD family hydrolase [Glycomyces paridis]
MSPEPREFDSRDPIATSIAFSSEMDAKFISQFETDRREPAPSPRIGVYGTVLFDLDRTLVDAERTEDRALRDTWDALVRKATGADYATFQLRFAQDDALLRNRFLRGEIELDHMRTARFAFLAEVPKARIDPAEVARHYESRLGANATLYTDAFPALERLHRSSKYRMGLVSNGIASVQRTKLDVTDISRFFDAITVSGDPAFRKPGPRLLHQALRSISGSPEGALYIGDSLERDGRCAQAAGVDFCWVNRGAGPGDGTPFVAEVRSLDELFTRVAL